MAGVSESRLYGYNLKIYDSDYLDSISGYTTIGTDVKECWNKFIQLCRKIPEDDLKGDFANKLSEFIESIGTKPGDDFYTEIESLTSNMQNYITEIDTDDAGIY